MLVNVNMSDEVYEYFRGYDLAGVAETLLEMYDWTALPPTSGHRDKEVRINITNPTYLAMYETVGPRSKKVSLGRLFEFAYQTEVLSLDRFKIFQIDTKDDPTPNLVARAYKALLEAQKYNDSKELVEITNIVYKYLKYVREMEEKQ